MRYILLAVSVLFASASIRSQTDIYIGDTIITKFCDFGPGECFNCEYDAKGELECGYRFRRHCPGSQRVSVQVFNRLTEYSDGRQEVTRYTKRIADVTACSG